MTITLTKPGPVHAETDAASGSRWYNHPITGERFMSVTTVLNYIAKFGLPDWAAGLAATAAFDNLPLLVRSSRVASCNTKGDDACGRCRACVITWLTNRHNDVRDDAADLGSKMHEAADLKAVFGEDPAIDEDARPLVDQWQRWRDAWQPEFLANEMTVISRKWGYAGTLDAILRLNNPDLLPAQFRHLAGLPICADWKNTKNIYMQAGIQVVAYSNADSVLLPDGSEKPMPPVEGGLIIHNKIIPGKRSKLQVREVYLTRENQDTFVHALGIARGMSASLNSVLSRPYTLKDS